MKLKPLATFLAAFAALGLGAQKAARADVAAVYAEGHGGLESGGGAAPNAGSPGGLGFRLGARVLIFEGYYDYTDFGANAAVSRGIVGLRGGFGSRDLRLVLRAGGGIIDERGGALTGTALDLTDHRGAVGRIGLAVEGRVAPMFLVGGGVDGETYVLTGFSQPGGGTTRTGSDVFVNLHLMFELGF
jgi:hypothetical protein